MRVANITKNIYLFTGTIDTAFDRLKYLKIHVRNNFDRKHGSLNKNYISR